ncbi:MAG: multidrug effflux MFS transporter [Pseudomonadales bacterium]|nr:multidrug effflux MFS transporter [Pseudomonadales bacterium]
MSKIVNKTPEKQAVSIGLAILLASVTALAPLGIDTYLPAITQMATELDTSVQRVQTSISIFFIGLALGLFFGGALSDRMGRKPMLIIGLSGFMLSSLALVFIEEVSFLLPLRFFQALFGGLATVNSPAIVRDRYTGKDSARMFALTGFIMTCAPLIAPAIGSLILSFFPWQVIFVFLTLYALVMILVVSFYLEESCVPDKSRDLKHLFSSYQLVIKNTKALPYVLLTACATAVMFIFLTNASFAYMQLFDVSKELFPVLFASNLLVMMALNRLSSYCLRWFSQSQLLLAGCVLQLLAVTAFVIANVIGLSLSMMVPLMMLSIGALGLITPNTMSLYMQCFSSAAGSASALIGIFNFGLGAIMGTVSSLLIHDHLLPMAICMWVMAAVAMSMACLQMFRR